MSDTPRTDVQESNEKAFGNDGLVEADFARQLERELSLASEILKAIKLDCGDNSCFFTKSRTGMRTNGRCRCLQNMDSSLQRNAERMLRTIRNPVGDK